jgi:hypothetical protein
VKPLSFVVLLMLCLAPACGGDDTAAKPRTSQQKKRLKSPKTRPANAKPPSAKPVSTRPTTSKERMQALPGRWQQHQKRSQSDEELEQLVAMGYAAGYKPPHADNGVLVYDTKRAQPGQNLYVSGHGPEAILIDMEGKVLHKWGYSFFDAWPDTKVAKEFPDHWRRAHLYPNGDLAAIWGGKGLVKLDKNSKPLWSHRDPIHHDLDIVGAKLFTLTRQSTKIPTLNEDKKVVMDYIVVFDEQGEVEQKVSIFDCFQNSAFAPIIKQMADNGDVLHTNTIEVLDGSHAHLAPAFKKGHILLSFRRIDTIAIVDLAAQEVVWTLRGMWHGQHQPAFLKNGHMLIFDNKGPKRSSRVHEFDPLTQQVFWTYGADDDQHFYSELLGSVARMPNGNTLITESDNGRAFEVTPAGDIVWEFVNPHTAGKNDEFVGSIYELIRLPADFPTAWADPTTAEINIDISRAAGKR